MTAPAALLGSLTGRFQVVEQVTKIILSRLRIAPMERQDPTTIARPQIGGIGAQHFFQEPFCPLQVVRLLAIERRDGQINPCG